jgi:hypothetical protein
MNFQLLLMDAIECRECPADMKSIGIFVPVQALLVAFAARDTGLPEEFSASP